MDEDSSRPRYVERKGEACIQQTVHRKRLNMKTENSVMQRCRKVEVFFSSLHGEFNYRSGVSEIRVIVVSLKNSNVNWCDILHFWNYY